MKKILEGITGSHAYGLNHAESDIDTRGAFVLPTEEILGFHSYTDTIDNVNPDYCLYEVGKLIKLAAANNPNVLELFYLESYLTLSEEGKLLVNMRDAFLSQKVKLTYGGYAIAQVKRLETRAAAGDASFKSKLRKRYSKHARHCFRLLQQGRQILEEGTLTVRVSNPEQLFEIGEQTPEVLKELFEAEFIAFNAVETELPEHPNYEKINETLINIREMNRS